MMKSITVEQLKKWKPCYDANELQKLIGNRNRLTIKWLLSLDISDGDKLWCLLHPEIIPEKRLHLLVCDFAEQALQRERKAGREPDKRCWAAIQAKRDWVAKKKTDAELNAAYSAAYSAAWSAINSAARSAAGSAQLKMAVAAAMGEEKK